VTSSTPFREEHQLRDGTRVTLRLIQPEDAEELRRAFGRLSPRSRFQRFLGGVPELTDEMVAYLTRVDGENHVAIVCSTDSLDLKSEVGLGVARFVRLNDEPQVAEAAVTVVDDWQSKGIGHLLLRALAAQALTRGIRVFRGEVLAENTRMCHLLEEVSASVRAVDGQTLVFDVPLEEPAEAIEKEPSHPLRRLLRAAAESLGMVPPEAPPAPEGEPGTAG
jgi:GNAT superfamily N-acetyltransferase